MPSEFFIGLLSGTSVDGIDAALVRFEPRVELVATHTLKFPAALQQELRALCVPGKNEIDRLGEADVRLGRAFAKAARDLLKKAKIAPEQVRAIGSHGQTIRHRPGAAAPFTLQIGDPNVIARETGIAVVADFRRKDMALGGQGAPLVPAFHEAIFREPQGDRVVVNIGGIANLTVLPGNSASSIAGFDTGPGNTLMDAWCRRVLGKPMDRNGALAAKGTVHADLLAAMLADRYFAQRAPKSTGPEYFSMAWLQRVLPKRRIADADVQATLCALTAQSIADAITQQKKLKNPEVFVCGGGAKNPTLMRMLAERLPDCRVDKTDALGVDGSWVEAMLFAWLARQFTRNAPGNVPAVTGASRPAVLGGLFLPI
ncbi:anhydro-N-acetylmuramic acid kinase [Oleiharenicola lentus]|uniref:anhydro-N-acetylmuramic acid kinase n=1 Tax=Oleiharenicola lentus TaxID=2508720 RepID=UPI003F673BC8